MLALEPLRRGPHEAKAEIAAANARRVAAAKRGPRAEGVAVAPRPTVKCLD
jgi:hypothetical protein